jgi:predicted O-methyltransferase YrrM
MEMRMPQFGDRVQRMEGRMVGVRDLGILQLMARDIRSVAQSGEGNSDPTGEALKRALSRAASATDPARGRIESIEAMRIRLSLDHRILEIIDFGAGTPESNWTEAEMNAGVKRTAMVSQAVLASCPERWGLFLFHLIREVKPERCLELGTGLGVSAAYQALALEMNGRGHLYTLEGALELAAMAVTNLRELDLARATVIPGRFRGNLEKVLEAHGLFDYAFIDGHHDEKATVEYFELILPRLSAGAILVFDDIAWSAGMARAWRTIREHPRISYSSDLTSTGIVRI